MYDDNQDLTPTCTFSGFLWRITFCLSMLLLLLYLGLNLPVT
ncbi:MAG TPA: hypothetical protein PKH77_24940 [Anaerolineae bacterium]|nr:hypothetical protein [Anaerolineae bacterium]